MDPVIQLAITLVGVAIDGVPKIIAAINASTTLSAEEKAKHIADLRSKLAIKDGEVAGVVFKDVDNFNAGDRVGERSGPLEP